MTDPKPNEDVVPIDRVIPWIKNPRGITKKEFARLKKHIKQNGIFKPLVVTPSGDGRFIVLGGNMRLAAMVELGFKAAWISIVDAPTEADRIKIALLDNDRAGYYDKERLAEITYPHAHEIALDDFHIDVGETVPLSDVLTEFGPDPESGAGGGKPNFNITVQCDSEDVRESTLERLRKMGLKCRV